MRALRIIAPLSLVALTGCHFDINDFNGDSTRFREDFHYTYAVGQNARIDAESFNGAVEIEGWDSAQVEITGTKSASSESARDAIRIDMHHGADSVEVRAVKPADGVGMSGGNAGVVLRLRVPRSAIVDHAITTNGRITVRDVSRAQHLKSSNGAITVRGVHGELDARTSNSSIDVEALDGSAILKTSNGRIRTDGISGGLSAETSNSSIGARFDSSPDAPVKLISSNGSIELTMEKAPRGSIRAETNNSSIAVHLPTGTAASVSAETSNSAISSDFEISGEHEKGHVKGDIGAGGPRIDLSTRNGAIRITRGAAQ